MHGQQAAAHPNFLGMRRRLLVDAPFETKSQINGAARVSKQVKFWTKGPASQDQRPKPERKFRYLSLRRMYNTASTRLRTRNLFMMLVM